VLYIAEEAFLRGADITLIRGINSVESQYHFNDIKIRDVKDLAREIKKNIKNKDIMVHAAAVSDFSINNKSKGKLKSFETLNLELSPTTKIFENIKKMNKDIFLVGFKAEYKVSRKVLVDRAYGLLRSANADLVVANDVGKQNIGFDTETNEVFVVDKKKRVKHLNIADKRVIGNKILDLI